MELTESNLFYRHPRLYDQVQADPQHTAATTCEELVDTFGLYQRPNTRGFRLRDRP